MPRRFARVSQYHDAPRLSANQQMIQLKLIENLQREWQCQIKIVRLSLRIPLIGFSSNRGGPPEKQSKLSKVHEHGKSNKVK